MSLTFARLRPEQRTQVQALLAEIERVDRMPPLSENKSMRLEGRLDTREHVVVDAAGAILGYGQAAWHRGDSEGEEGHWAIEIALLPDLRDPELTAELIDNLRRDVGGSAVTLWARAGYVAIAATEHGWVNERLLWEMRRRLPIADLAPPAPGVPIETFRMGADENAWLEANNAAFAGHPENGSMTRRDLERRMAQPWFDPGGFFIAWDGDHAVGSCWTKVHGRGLGEIYIIGVVPGWEGKGLGLALVARGLDHLYQERNVTAAMLFVESTNQRAAKLYDGMGFQVARSIRAFRYAG